MHKDTPGVHDGECRSSRSLAQRAHRPSQLPRGDVRVLEEAKCCRLESELTLI